MPERVVMAPKSPFKSESAEMEQEEVKKNRGGRHPKPAAEIASKKVNFWVTEGEFTKLEKQFHNSTYRSKSEMLHDMVFHNRLAQRDSMSLTLATEVQNLIREIKAIGTNYHQAVKKINSLTDDRTLPFELEKLVDLTEELQAKEKEFFQIVIKLRERWLQE
jgi:hypothetical protein